MNCSNCNEACNPHERLVCPACGTDGCFREDGGCIHVDVKTLEQFAQFVVLARRTGSSMQTGTGKGIASEYIRAAEKKLLDETIRVFYTESRKLNG